jgi:uncharacterized OB-fold protein
MAQFLKGVDLSGPEEFTKKLKVGMPVKAVFKDRADRKASVLGCHIESMR